MANLDRANGFTIVSPEKYTPRKYLLVNATTLGDGEVAFMASSGLVQAARSDTYIVGVVTGSMRNGVTDEVVTIAATADSSRGDYVMVYDDPNAQFVGQITTYALTDPYTTKTETTCFDLTLTTLVQEIDAGASTYDEVQVVAPAPDPVTGDLSIVGVNAKVVFQFNKKNHVFGITV